MSIEATTPALQLTPAMEKVPTVSQQEIKELAVLISVGRALNDALNNAKKMQHTFKRPPS